MHDLLDNVTVWGLKVEKDSVLTVHACIWNHSVGENCFFRSGFTPQLK